ncbi:MAG: tetratricopeptide repeat protein [Candidatus Caldatribacteriaceae bacterium]
MVRYRRWFEITIGFWIFILAFPIFSLEAPKDLLGQALDAKREGDYDTAMEFLERCIQEGFRVHDAYYEMGLILLERKEYKRAFTISEKAIQAFEEYLEKNPQDHWSFFRLGYIHEIRSESPLVSEWIQAEEALQKALSLSPRNSLYLLHLGFVYYRMKEYQKAEETMLLALSEEPGNVEIHYFLALVLKAQGKKEEAKREFRFVVEHASSEYRNYESARRELARLERTER